MGQVRKSERNNHVSNAAFQKQSKKPIQSVDTEAAELVQASADPRVSAVEAEM